MQLILLSAPALALGVRSPLVNRLQGGHAITPVVGHAAMPISGRARSPVMQHSKGGGQIATALGREPFVIGLAESVFVEIGGPGISGVIVHTLFGCRVRRRDGSVGVGHGLVTHDHLFRA